MFGKLPGPVRTAIRKAEKGGIKVRFESSSEAVEQYYSLHCLTRRKHGAPPQPYRFFGNIYEHVIKRGMGFVALAQHENRAVAGAVFFHFKGKAVYKFGASDLGAVNLRPNNLVMWKAIEHLARSGCQTLNFGRTSLGNEGLRRFKLGWGALEERLGYTRFDCVRQRFATDVDRSMGMHAAVFRKLPIFILKQAGSLLYPHLD
jgi:lipid II:glycine glycyltransferase (peptidoglycan interpeptide bridge formation enzyme)